MCEKVRIRTLLRGFLQYRSVANDSKSTVVLMELRLDASGGVKPLSIRRVSCSTSSTQGGALVVHQLLEPEWASVCDNSSSLS